MSLATRPRSRRALVSLVGLAAIASTSPLGCARASRPPAPAKVQSSATPPRANEPDPDKLVKLALIADVTAVAPGQEFTLAAQFAVEPSWHVYWLNPGEAGLPTEAQFAVPEGFRAGAVRYPGPVQFESPGPIVSYGYEHAVLLSAPVAAPDPLAGDALAFSVEASWLACRESCVRGRGTATLSLPVARPDRPSGPDHGEAFTAHAARLPRPLSALPGARHEWRTAGEARQLVLTVPGAARLALFPTQDTEPGLVGVAVKPGADDTSLWLMLEPDAPHVRGVLAVMRDDATAFYSIDLSPAAPADPAR